MSRPHDSWAEVYDLAYREEFGGFYERLTDLTIQEIVHIVPPPASVIDFGAGTGRLSIPLARAGYQVTAVEPSGPMLEQLRRAQGDLSLEITCIESTMQNFSSEARFDLAICVFTVVIYLLEEAQLRGALEKASECLKPGGKLLLDVPSQAVFASHRCHTSQVRREVTIEPLDADLYEYRESIAVKGGTGEEKLFQDSFQIRSWRVDQVLRTARSCGFRLVERLSDRFMGTGSEYLLLDSSSTADR